MPSQSSGKFNLDPTNGIQIFKAEYEFVSLLLLKLSATYHSPNKSFNCTLEVAKLAD